MSTTIDHSIEAATGVSLAEGGDGAQGADVRTTMIGTSANGLSLPLLDELAMLASAGPPSSTPSSTSPTPSSPYVT